jgi:hypothetical protein
MVWTASTHLSSKHKKHQCSPPKTCFRFNRSDIVPSPFRFRQAGRFGAGAASAWPTSSQSANASQVMHMRTGDD